jgi:hypothetical protein
MYTSRWMNKTLGNYLRMYIQEIRSFYDVISHKFASYYINKLTFYSDWEWTEKSFYYTTTRKEEEKNPVISLILFSFVIDNKEKEQDIYNIYI